MTTPYTDESGRTWQLDHPFLDNTGVEWDWDGKPFVLAVGPVLRSATALFTAPLLCLVAEQGLWQMPLTYPELAHLMDPQDGDPGRFADAPKAVAS